MFYEEPKAVLLECFETKRLTPKDKNVYITCDVTEAQHIHDESTTCLPIATRFAKYMEWATAKLTPMAYKNSLQWPALDESAYKYLRKKIGEKDVILTLATPSQDTSDVDSGPLGCTLMEEQSVKLTLSYLLDILQGKIQDGGLHIRDKDSIIENVDGFIWWPAQALFYHDYYDNVHCVIVQEKRFLVLPPVNLVHQPSSYKVTSSTTNKSGKRFSNLSSNFVSEYSRDLMNELAKNDHEFVELSPTLQHHLPDIDGVAVISTGNEHNELCLHEWPSLTTNQPVTLVSGEDTGPVPEVDHSHSAEAWTTTAASLAAETERTASTDHGEVIQETNREASDQPISLLSNVETDPIIQTDIPHLAEDWKTSDTPLIAEENLISVPSEGTLQTSLKAVEMCVSTGSTSQSLSSSINELQFDLPLLLESTEREPTDGCSESVLPLPYVDLSHEQDALHTNISQAHHMVNDDVLSENTDICCDSIAKVTADVAHVHNSNIDISPQHSPISAVVHVHSSNDITHFDSSHKQDTICTNESSTHDTSVDDNSLSYDLDTSTRIKHVASDNTNVHSDIDICPQHSPILSPISSNDKESELFKSELTIEDDNTNFSLWKQKFEGNADVLDTTADYLECLQLEMKEYMRQLGVEENLPVDAVHSARRSKQNTLANNDQRASLKKKHRNVHRPKKSAKDIKLIRHQANIFLRFCAEQREAMLENSPDLDNNQVSEMLKKKWNTMSQNEKEPYVVKFYNELRQMRDEHPEWEDVGMEANRCAELKPVRQRKRGFEASPNKETGKSYREKNTNGSNLDVLVQNSPQWIQCYCCKKWRKLEVGVDSDDLPLKWNCSFNSDPQHNTCNADEEWRSPPITGTCSPSEHSANNKNLTSVDQDNDQHDKTLLQTCEEVLLRHITQSAEVTASKIIVDVNSKEQAGEWQVNEMRNELTRSLSPLQLHSGKTIIDTYESKKPSLRLTSTVENSPNIFASHQKMLNGSHSSVKKLSDVISKENGDQEFDSTVPNHLVNDPTNSSTSLCGTFALRIANGTIKDLDDNSPNCNTRPPYDSTLQDENQNRLLSSSQQDHLVDRRKLESGFKASSGVFQHFVNRHKNRLHRTGAVKKKKRRKSLFSKQMLKVQCNKCRKWRDIPASIYMQISESWTCCVVPKIGGSCVRNSSEENQGETRKSKKKFRIYRESKKSNVHPEKSNATDQQQATAGIEFVSSECDITGKDALNTTSTSHLLDGSFKPSKQKADKMDHKSLTDNNSIGHTIFQSCARGQNMDMDNSDFTPASNKQTDDDGSNVKEAVIYSRKKNNCTKTAVRRPMNAFLQFCAEFREIVAETNPNCSKREVTALLRRTWQHMTPEEKDPYILSFKAEVSKFSAGCPDYNTEKIALAGRGKTKKDRIRSRNASETISFKELLQRKYERDKAKSNLLNVNSGLNSASEMHDTAWQNQEDSWAQCDDCNKWRKLPPSVDTRTLPKKWVCSLNPDTERNRCEVEEEVVADLWNYHVITHSDDDSTDFNNIEKEEAQPELGCTRVGELTNGSPALAAEEQTEERQRKVPQKRRECHKNKRKDNRRKHALSQSSDMCAFPPVHLLHHSSVKQDERKICDESNCTSANVDKNFTPNKDEYIVKELDALSECRNSLCTDGDDAEANAELLKCLDRRIKTLRRQATKIKCTKKFEKWCHNQPASQPDPLNIDQLSEIKKTVSRNRNLFDWKKELIFGNGNVLEPKVNCSNAKESNVGMMQSEYEQWVSSVSGNRNNDAESKSTLSSDKITCVVDNMKTVNVDEVSKHKMTVGDLICHETVPEYSDPESIANASLFPQEGNSTDSSIPRHEVSLSDASMCEEMENVIDSSPSLDKQEGNVTEVKNTTSSSLPIQWNAIDSSQGKLGHLTESPLSEVGNNGDAEVGIVTNSSILEQVKNTADSSVRKQMGIPTKFPAFKLANRADMTAPTRQIVLRAGDFKRLLMSAILSKKRLGADTVELRRLEAVLNFVNAQPQLFGLQQSKVNVQAPVTNTSCCTTLDEEVGTTSTGFHHNVQHITERTLPDGDVPSHSLTEEIETKPGESSNDKPCSQMVPENVMADSKLTLPRNDVKAVGNGSQMLTCTRDSGNRVNKLALNNQQTCNLDDTDSISDSKKDDNCNKLLDNTGQPVEPLQSPVSERYSLKNIKNGRTRFRSLLKRFYEHRGRRQCSVCQKFVKIPDSLINNLPGNWKCSACCDDVSSYRSDTNNPVMVAKKPNEAIEDGNPTIDLTIDSPIKRVQETVISNASGCDSTNGEDDAQRKGVAVNLFSHAKPDSPAKLQHDYVVTNVSSGCHTPDEHNSEAKEILHQSDIKVKRKRKSEQNSSPSKPKRPTNGFIRFTVEYREMVSEFFPNSDNREVSIILGRLWRKLIPEEKEPYKTSFSDELNKIRTEHPDWNYAVSHERNLDLGQVTPDRLRARNLEQVNYKNLFQRHYTKRLKKVENESVSSQIPDVVVPKQNEWLFNSTVAAQNKEEVWVQCDDCNKWRKLPPLEESQNLPEKWTCKLNRNQKRNFCEAEEEEY